MKMGHNVVLGGSHYDEYIVEYVDVSASTYQDPALFAPPTTMECIDFGQSGSSDREYGGNDEGQRKAQLDSPHLLTSLRRAN